MSKFQSPVLFDANIIMDFKGQLEKLFSHFENILIHEKVYSEVLDQSVKNELDMLTEKMGIKYVTDPQYTDEASISLYKKCDEELRATFDIENNHDMGEYKTLLYAKFNVVCLISTQDTTIWRLLLDSENFKGLQCITVQDLAYYLYLNNENKKAAKNFYEKFTREEHGFKYFKKYMEQNNNEIPKYIEFEYDRICNFKELVSQYYECFSNTYSLQETESEISEIASTDDNTCLSCLLSRMNKNVVDFTRRCCVFDYVLNDDSCLNQRKEFKKKIRNMAR